LKINKISKPKTYPVDVDQILKQPSAPMVLLSALGGGMKIEHKNHHYIYHYKRLGLTFMRCVNFVKLGCGARVLLNQNRVFDVSIDHNHEDEAKVEGLSKNVCSDGYYDVDSE
jgi:hypothetical protein